MNRQTIYQRTYKAVFIKTPKPFKLNIEIEASSEKELLESICNIRDEILMRSVSRNTGVLNEGKINEVNYSWVIDDDIPF